MRTRNLILLAIVAATGAAVAGTWLGDLHSRPNVAPPPVERVAIGIDPKYLDFGEVWETDRFELSLPVTNRESQHVEFTELHGSCSCVKTEAPGDPIPPGGTALVRLTLDLRPTRADPSGSPNRIFATQIGGSVKVGDRVSRVGWQVKGTVKRWLRATPTLDFGRCSELARPVSPLVVPLELTASVGGVTAETNTPQFEAMVRRAEPSGYELVVTPSSSLKLGEYSGAITLGATGRDGQLLSALALPLSARIIPDIEAIPESVVVGSRDVGVEVMEALTFRSLTGRSFSVDRVETDGVGVSASVGPEGRSCVVRVKVLAPGVLSGSVRVLVRPADGRPVELVIPVQGHGFLPG